MAIPGLLVEYLITGAIALIWLYPLLKNAGLARIDTSYLPLLLLGLYLVGMAIDFFAWALTMPVKHQIRGHIEKRYGIGGPWTHGSGVARQARFAIYAPELAKEANMRSSRDRIARGAIVNSILATIFYLPIPVGIGLILISLLMWAGFERLSYSYELKAEQILNEKIQRDEAKPNA